MLQKLHVNERVRSSTEATKENAIKDMFFSKLLFYSKNKQVPDDIIGEKRERCIYFLPKNIKFQSDIVDEYMDDKKKYLPYIIKEKREQFMIDYADVFQHVQNQNDHDVYFKLLNWEHACQILELLSKRTYWKAVDQKISEQDHSGGTMLIMAAKIEFFSPYGEKFIKHVYRHHHHH